MPNVEWPTDDAGVFATVKVNKEDIQYISSQVIFKDGTSTNIRKFNLQF